MIEVDLGDLSNKAEAISGFLREKFRTEVSIKGRTLVLSERTSGGELRVKELKAVMKRALHHLGLQERRRILAEEHKIRVVKLKEKTAPATKRKGSIPSARESVPYLFP